MELTAVPRHVPPAIPGEPRHVPALDGLRGVAILLVMVFHMSILADVVRGDRPWVDSAWLRVATFGWCGVDLFFVLSGFLITGILLDAKAAVGWGDGGGGVSLGDGRDRPHFNSLSGGEGADGSGVGGGYFGAFYARRVLRIFPLYYVVVVVALVVLPHVHNVKSGKFGAIRGDEGWYWGFLSNWIIGWRAKFRHGILDITWSLAIEEQFYLVWPAVVLLVNRRVLGWVCVGVIVAAIATRTGMYVGLHSPEIRVMTWTPCRMDALAAGAGVAVLSRGAGGLVRWRRAAGWVGSAAGAMLLAYWFWQGPSWDGGKAGQTVGYSVLAVFFAAVVALAATAGPATLARRFLGIAPLRTLGRFSYAIYLFHFPIRALIRDEVYGPGRFWRIGGSQLPGQFVFYGICMSISLGLAWLSWQGLEKHFLRLKRWVPMAGERPRRDAAGVMPTGLAAAEATGT